MAFKVENFFSTVSNIQNVKAQVAHYEYWNESSNDVTASGYFPAKIGLKEGDVVTVFTANKQDHAEYYVNSSGNLVATGISVIKNDLDDLGDAVDEINALIPSTATEENQLATQSDVAEVLPTLPSEASKTYVLKCTTDSEGVATLSWVEEE